MSRSARRRSNISTACRICCSSPAVPPTTGARATCCGCPARIDNGTSIVPDQGGYAVAFIPISDDNPLRSIRVPWVTYGLIATNILVFVLQVAGSTDGGAAALASFALIPSELFNVPATGDIMEVTPGALAVPKWLTLITYQFMHGGVLHLLSNMLFLWVFGDNV